MSQSSFNQPKNQPVESCNTHFDSLQTAMNQLEPREVRWDYLTLPSGPHAGILLWENDSTHSLLLSNDPIEPRRFLRIILKACSADPILRSGVARINKMSVANAASSRVR